MNIAVESEWVTSSQLWGDLRVFDGDWVCLGDGTVWISVIYYCCKTINLSIIIKI
jgi:hypothetical protein